MGSGNEDSVINKLKTFVINQLESSDNTNIQFFDKISKELRCLIQHTVYEGESNSALLIGPKGIGKTKLIQDLLRTIKSEKYFISNGVLVELNGLIHTDDRLALISTTTQMKLENSVEGKVFGSFAENLSFLIESLRRGSKDESKSVIFILEEFDLFCGHVNQTLLYNLFDISQSAQTPIMIIGVTSRLDVIELLEKRVKSRFSHRQYFLFDGEKCADKSNIELEIDLLKERLLITDGKLKSVGKKNITLWNESVNNVLSDKKFKTALDRFLELGGNDYTLKNILVQAISQLNDQNSIIKPAQLTTGFKIYEADEIVEQILDLNITELCLLIAMKHHVEIYDSQPLNFQMAFTRYVKFTCSSSNVQCVPKHVAMKAFEHIKAMELIQTVSPHGKLRKEYQIFKLLLSPDQIMEAVRRWQGLPTEVGQWAISSLVH